MREALTPCFILILQASHDQTKNGCGKSKDWKKVGGIISTCIEKGNVEEYSTDIMKAVNLVVDAAVQWTRNSVFEKCQRVRSWMTKMKLFFKEILLFMFFLLQVAMPANAQHADYWKKYGGMPPLDIRVSIDGKAVQGLFDVARELVKKENSQERMALIEVIAIPVKNAQKLSLKVEISPRDAKQWTDVTKHPNLLITAPAGRIDVDKRAAELRMRGDTLHPELDVGIQTVIFYYSDRNVKDEQAAYTEIYFDIAGKP